MKTRLVPFLLHESTVIYILERVVRAFVWGFVATVYVLAEISESQGRQGFAFGRISCFFIAESGRDYK